MKNKFLKKVSPGVPTHLLNPNKLLLVCFKHAALQWNTSGGDWRTWNFFFHFGLKFRSGFGPESEAQNSRHFSHASKSFSKPMGIELEAFSGNQKKLFLDVHLQTYIGRCVLGFRRDISARSSEVVCVLSYAENIKIDLQKNRFFSNNR